MQSRDIDITFPVGGLNRAASNNQQPPYSFVDGNNVAAFDVIEKRGRGGSRPMLERCYSDKVGDYTGTTASPTNANPSVVTDAAYPNWNVTGVRVGDSFVITSGTNATAGTYTVAAIASTGASITLDRNAMTGAPAGNVVFTLTPTNPPSTLATVQPTSGGGSGYWNDDFTSTPSSTYWTKETNVLYDGMVTQNDVVDGGGLIRSAIGIPASTTDDVVYYRSALADDVVASSGYSVSLGIFYAGLTYGPRPDPQSVDGGIWRLMVGLSDSAPAFLTDGLTLEIAPDQSGTHPSDGGALLWNAALKVAGINTAIGNGSTSAGLFTTAILNGAVEAKLTVTTNSSSQITQVVGTIAGEALFTYTATWGASTQHRTGFGIGVSAGASSAQPNIDYFSIRYSKTASSTFRNRRLVAIRNSQVRYESDAGSLSVASKTNDAGVAAAITINPAGLVQAAEHRGKLYIADYGDYASASDGTLDAAGTSFDSNAVYTNWTVLGIVDPADVCVYIQSTGALGRAILGAWRVSAIAAGAITLSSSANAGAGAETAIQFRIVKRPKKFDYPTAIMSPWDDSTYPTAKVPVGCELICQSQDCIYLAGQSFDPTNWFKSRQGNALDWNFGGDAGDAARPIAGTSTDAGVLPDRITALAAYAGDFVIFGTLNGLWMLRGNPLIGGRIDNLSHEYGVISKAAWCYGMGPEFYFMSKTGLCVYNGAVQRLSGDTIPQELLDIDPAAYRVQLQYDTVYRGVRIKVTPTNEVDVGSHWFHDLRTGALLPETYPVGQQAWCMTQHEMVAQSRRSALFFGKDGYIRKPSDSAATDDGTAVSSYVLIGPFGGSQTDIMLQQCVAVLSDASGDVTAEILAGETPERARQATAVSIGTWAAGRNYRNHPRIRGRCFFLKLSATTPWALEIIHATIAQLGVSRKL